MNLQNLIDYGRNFDIDIFAGVNVPEPLNNETMKSAIMIRCGLLTPVFGEPEVFKDAVSHWFLTHQWNFKHLIDIIKAEYSPIENFDRYEEWNEKHTGDITDNGASKDQHARSGKSTDKHSGTDTEENTVSAYNSNSYQPDSKRSDIYGKQLENTHNDTEAIDRTNTNKNTRDLNDTHTGHLHGNIGVTTNQQMIEQELELLRHFDIYGYIAERFEEDNMLMIY